MTHELSLKVYKVKACLLRLKCSVNSKYKTQVLFSLDLISFQFLYVIGRHNYFFNKVMAQFTL